MSLTTIIISDLPLWKDHPFGDVPEWLEIRRGEVAGNQVAMFSDMANDMHAHATGDVSREKFALIVRDLKMRRPMTKAEIEEQKARDDQLKAEAKEARARYEAVYAAVKKEKAERKAEAEKEKAANRLRIDDEIIAKARAILAKRGEKLD